ncbi:MAG: sll0787 family AIR synthase-like protein [Cyanobacteria bacterium J06554_6]
MRSDLRDLVTSLRTTTSILDKQDIQTAARTLGNLVQGDNNVCIRLGDDCAAIPDGEGYLLMAAEGIWPQLVKQDPWFAGWCAVMVNLSDVAAMGGTPVAVVDALWSQSIESSARLWQGLQAAAQAYGVPIVGGHTNCHSPYEGLAVAVLGRAEQLITSFGAQPGDDLVIVVNLAGTYYGNYPFWNAATEAPPEQLKQQLALLPKLAQTGWCNAGKDISMGGLVGTLLMLAEASGCGAILYLDQIPCPNSVSLKKWLTSFPSFGFLLSVPAEKLTHVESLFRPLGLTCEAIGKITSGSQILFQQLTEQQLFWDLEQALTGFGAR